MTEEEQKLYKNFKQAQVRQQILDAVREDLIGPRADGKVLTEDPSKTYIAGILFPTDSNFSEEEEFDQTQDIETLADEEHQTEDGESEGIYEETDDLQRKKFKKPCSLGVSCYVAKSTKKIKATVNWGSYTATEIPTQAQPSEEPKEEGEEKEAKKKSKKYEYSRTQNTETIEIDFDSVNKNRRIPLKSNPKIYIYVITRMLKTGYRMVTVYVQNADAPGAKIPEWQNTMYQTELILNGINNEDCFIAEYICRENEIAEEFYYKSRPVFARGRQCAAVWNFKCTGKAVNEVRSSFIPDYEIAGVKAEIEEIEKYSFSAFKMKFPDNKEWTFEQLSKLLSMYENWIHSLSSASINTETYNAIIGKCNDSLGRMKNGIDLLRNDEKAFKAFLFMNEAMYSQRAIAEYAKIQGSNIKDEVMLDADKKPRHLLEWRPFQIAFILLNLVGIADKTSTDRTIVDLLYFPTGGGKTEAYLGLIAFTVGLRRLNASEDSVFNRDGGVTVFLRYTLRLLTTQQRDRLLKLIIAMETIRNSYEKKGNPVFGKERISIGFWVGGQLTPNDFTEYNDQFKKKKFIRMVSGQLVRCPYCGRPLDENNYHVNTDTESINIYCSNPDCLFAEQKKTTLPVYLVDKEIYRKCPTVIISTVDKFARLPWDEKVGLLFGHTNRYCPRHGYLAVGEGHSNSHNRASGLPQVEIEECKPFFPPELIIQDELHLITGPLGTIYGGYETAIENLCTIDGYKPKYVVSTATIKNAGEQIKTLYGRTEFAQFPPSGTDIRDSFFMKEIDLPETSPALADENQLSAMVSKKQKPFREYVGVCVPGQSVKTTLIRLYSAILQKAFELAKTPEYEDFIDPYYTLIGYFNSIRELGGAVRLLDDDIVKRIDHLIDKYEYKNHRYMSVYSKKEITSRIKSYEISEILEHLAIPYKKNEERQDCYDVVIATNMIAVGMDVDRLGLMVVLGQPKQNAEYIQATSRVGRQSPGLIFSLYNPYRTRDLSNYENFAGFHSQMYRYVEGTTSTPFAARAIDRDIHALVISLIRLLNEKTASNAAGILDLSDVDIEKCVDAILARVDVVDSTAHEEAEKALSSFIGTWKELAAQGNLIYHTRYKKADQQRLMSYYGLEPCGYKEKPTLNSMRDVEQSATVFLWENK
ncbi:MAG: DISARM system helicase DrmA [Treponema sp.]|nr:DISARM system helicase DrmA [Treponema sp.]